MSSRDSRGPPIRLKGRDPTQSDRMPADSWVRLFVSLLAGAGNSKIEPCQGDSAAGGALWISSLIESRIRLLGR